MKLHPSLFPAALGLALTLLGNAARAQDDQKHDTPHDHPAPKVDPAAQIVPYDKDLFSADPRYDRTWDAAEQEQIYGGKSPVKTARPLLEWGRDLYREGPLQKGRSFLFGDANELFPQFMLYGDWRTAVGFADVGSTQFGQAATRFNFDLDLKLTATERIHAFIQPLEKNGDITRIEFGEIRDGDDDTDLNLDGNLDALFFEGDLGALLRGSDGTVSNFDMPFAVGLMPLLFQNGVWLEDAFTGVAFTLPAKNSKALNISNYDVTFFAGLDRVDTGAVAGVGGDDNDATIIGFNSFLEWMTGYWEIGYGYTFGEAGVGDQDVNYHNLTAAFSRRYGACLSNTVRAIFNVGQDSDVDTADGVLLLVENSLITKSPYTVVPYFNLFAGFGHPQSLARNAGAGGVLKNTGINFEGDALTAFPSLNATGNDSFGAAIGLDLIPGLGSADPAGRSQLVLELAGLHATDDDPNDAAPDGDEFAIGARWQKPLNNFLILRSDATIGLREEEDEYAAVRFELRWKF
jgi:hypothetical protein